MQYNILTVCDNTYFIFAKILINSILDKCDTDKINSIIVVNNGLTDKNIEYLQSKTDLIRVVDTGINTNFNGGVWGPDWQTNVKSKTVYLYKIIDELREPVLMLDSDMLVIEDLHNLAERGGDIQVCVRPGNPTPYIGSYFFSLNHEKSLPFIKQWCESTQTSNTEGAKESPALVRTVLAFKPYMDIVEMNQSTVNVLEPKYMTEETHIIHFKGSSLPQDIPTLIKSRITDRGWDEYITNYV